MAWPERAARALALVAAILAASWTVVLMLQAGRGTFATDECFHAYAGEWILAHHRLPDVMPEFYSGFYYYYHPMLHVLGALSIAAFGLHSLHFLPVAFAAVALAALLAGLGSGVPLASRAWAALLCVANGLFASFAVRLYVESLTALAFTLAVLLLHRLRRAPAMSAALALGVVTGFSLLTKFSGWLLWGLLLALAAVFALRRERRLAGLLLVSAALALAIALPWLLRNQALFGSAIYPLRAPDMDRALYVLNRAKFSISPAQFLRNVPDSVGLGLLGTTAAALAFAAYRRRWGLREGLIGFSLAGMLLVAITPMASARHLIPFVPVLALAASDALFDALRSRRAAFLGVSSLLAVAALATVGNMPDFRRAADLPPSLHQALTEIGSHVPEDATILSLWTYDTFYYARRKATWPNPWGQRVHPKAMFTERDTARFMEELAEYRIDYILVPLVLRREAFNSANYPEQFVDCAEALIHGGELRIEWSSESYALLARGAPLDRAPATAKNRREP